MKKTIILMSLLSLLLLFFFQINYTEKYTNPLDEKVLQALSSMTLEEKIGQMLILYETHSEVNEEVKTLFNEIKPGGIILNKENITTYTNTKRYIEEIKTLSKFPLIVSIDQEGGRVQRLQLLKDITPTNLPSMFEIGKTQDVSLSYEVGKILAEQVKTLGINVVYAPVCDIVTNKENTGIGTRSFGNSPTLVSSMCTNFAKGIEEEKVIATYKHFPGHGDTTTDSHTSLPIIKKNLEELENFELIPFKEAINENAKIIMVGHIAFPNITNDLTPASLSKTIITDILKKKLNYNGLVITDALNMKALTDNYTDDEIYTMAINAGVDLLLMPNNPHKAIQIIKETINEERINESVAKILRFKFTYLENIEILDSSYLNQNSYQDILNKIEQ